MNKQDVAKELVAVAKDLTAAPKNAAGGMIGDASKVKKYHSLLSSALRQLDGLFYYRLRGDGATNMDGSPALDTQQIREAQRVWMAVGQAKKAVDGVWDEIKKMDRGVKEIDDFMNFS